MDISKEKIRVKLPRNPGKETFRVFAHDKLTSLVQAAKKQPGQLSTGRNGTNLHEERQGEGQRDEEVLRGNSARLEDVMAKKGSGECQRTDRHWSPREMNVQDRNVAEEDTDDERADRRGDRGAVHTPRWRLLEDTRAARASREQVTKKKK